MGHRMAGSRVPVAGCRADDAASSNMLCVCVWLGRRLPLTRSVVLHPLLSTYYYLLYLLPPFLKARPQHAMGRWELRILGYTRYDTRDFRPV